MPVECMAKLSFNRVVLHFFLLNGWLKDSRSGMPGQQGLIFVKQFFNVLNIIQGVIHEELDFRYDPDLLANAPAQFITDFTRMSPDVFKQLWLVTGGKQAKVNLGLGKVAGYMDLRNSDHGMAEQIPALLLEDIAYVTLNKA